MGKICHVKRDHMRGFCYGIIQRATPFKKFENILFNLNNIKQNYVRFSNHVREGSFVLFKIGECPGIRGNYSPKKIDRFKVNEKYQGYDVSLIKDKAEYISQITLNRPSYGILQIKPQNNQKGWIYCKNEDTMYCFNNDNNINLHYMQMGDYVSFIKKGNRHYFCFCTFFFLCLCLCFFGYSD